MKSLCLAGVVIGAIAAAGHADCAYFRVSAKPQQCAAADPKTVKANDPYPQAEASVPELEESDHAAFIKIDCACAYSLTGSDPRCDTDQTFERSSIVGVKDPDEACRRAPALCRDVCPARLP